MPTIQVRDVPDDVHRNLPATGRAGGIILSAWWLGQSRGEDQGADVVPEGGHVAEVLVGGGVSVEFPEGLQGENATPIPDGR
jgi:hypothetical protein